MKTKEYAMREMVIDQCLGTGREYTREELQAFVNKLRPCRKKANVFWKLQNRK
jgi:hypothetical protein